jgi:hypothetical protein
MKKYKEKFKCYHLNNVDGYIVNTLILKQFFFNIYSYPAIVGINIKGKIGTPLQQINMNLLDQHIFPPSQS